MINGVYAVALLQGVYAVALLLWPAYDDKWSVRCCPAPMAYDDLIGVYAVALLLWPDYVNGGSCCPAPTYSLFNGGR